MVTTAMTSHNSSVPEASGTQTQNSPPCSPIVYSATKIREEEKRLQVVSEFFFSDATKFRPKFGFQTCFGQNRN